LFTSLKKTNQRLVITDPAFFTTSRSVTSALNFFNAPRHQQAVQRGGG